MQERVIMEKFKHFTEKDRRVEAIDFDAIVRPYDHASIVARLEKASIYEIIMQI